VLTRLLALAAAAALFGVYSPLALQEVQTLPAGDGSARAEEAVRSNNLGVAYMSQQHFEKALQMFRKAGQLDPKLRVAKLNEGIALVNLQKIEEARTLLENITHAEPGDARAWYNLGLLFKNSGDAQQALEPFQRAVKLSPNDPDAHYFLGVILAELKRDDEAAGAFESALRLNPYHASAEFGLARSLMRVGRSDEARKHLERFQHLTTTKLGSPVTLNYGDQGALSFALDARDGSKQAEAPIKVSFVPVPGALPGTLQMSGDLSNALAPGACWLDAFGSGRPDLFLTSAGPDRTMKLFRNLGDSKFADVTATAGLPHEAARACAAADYDNDGRADLAISTADKVLLLHNEGNGKFTNATETSGLTNRIAGVTSLLWVDYDHDGDADLIALASTGEVVMVFRNNGNGKFTNVTPELGLPQDGAAQATFTDYNNDRAIDLVFAGAQSALFENPREGKWLRHDISSEPLPAATSVAVLDFNKDGFMDIAVAYGSAPGISLWRNIAGKKFEAVPLPIKLRRAWGVTPIDYDNDGWVDLAVTGEDENGDATVRLLRNEGERGFRDVSAEIGLTKIAWKSPRGITAVDFDLDGDADLLVTQVGAAPMLLRNDGGNQNHSLRVSLKGLNDNKSAIGAKVEVFAGELYQKFEVGGAGSAGQSVLPLLVGLGHNRSADVVRMLWPTGVLQDEAEITQAAVQFTEIDRRGSSCPVLFAWDGEKFRFVSDMIGAGVIGHWISPGQRNIADPTEYLKINFSPKPQNGILKFRFMEPMEETVYADAVRLLAIDHAASTEVYPNEFFASNPPFPEFKVIASQHPAPVTRAYDDAGHYVTELLKNDDRRYVGNLDLLPYKGFAMMHSLDLDLGDAYDGGPLRLLMTGYIEYFTATSMFAAHQAGIEPVVPFVQALGADGKWVRVVEDMGFPAGLHRTTVADLTGRLPRGVRRIRITTNLQIYWDQILVDRTRAQPAVRLREVPLSAANLRFHGYPEAIEGSSPGDLTYSYEQVSATGPYTRQAGEYTRYGDVTELLRRADDRFVIFGSGEELALEFDAAALPPVPQGWKRDYFFFADGFEKDMDFYAADFLYVEPLPAHSGGEYPDHVAYPADASHLRYRLEYNTRGGSDQRTVDYRFHFGATPRN
jgi:tetratricopeptide (TPR) repeat protein